MRSSAGACVCTLHLSRSLPSRASSHTKSKSLSLSLFVFKIWTPKTHIFPFGKLRRPRRKEGTFFNEDVDKREVYFEVYLILLSDYLHASVATP